MSVNERPAIACSDQDYPLMFGDASRDNTSDEGSRSIGSLMYEITSLVLWICTSGLNDEVFCYLNL